MYDTFNNRKLLNNSNLYNYWKGNNPDFADMDHPFATAWRNLPKFEKGFGVDEENPGLGWEFLLGLEGGS